MFTYRNQLILGIPNVVSADTLLELDPLHPCSFGEQQGETK